MEQERIFSLYLNILGYKDYIEVSWTSTSLSFFTVAYLIHDDIVLAENVTANWKLNGPFSKVAIFKTKSV